MFSSSLSTPQQVEIKLLYRNPSGPFSTFYQFSPPSIPSTYLLPYLDKTPRRVRAACVDNSTPRARPGLAYTRFARVSSRYIFIYLTQVCVCVITSYSRDTNVCVCVPTSCSRDTNVCVWVSASCSRDTAVCVCCPVPLPHTHVTPNPSPATPVCSPSARRNVARSAVCVCAASRAHTLAGGLSGFAALKAAQRPKLWS